MTGRSATRVDGHPATRLDFEHETALGHSYFSTWLVEGPDGRVWQLLYGSLDPRRPVADELVAGFGFVG